MSGRYRVELDEAAARATHHALDYYLKAVYCDEGKPIPDVDDSHTARAHAALLEAFDDDSCWLPAFTHDRDAMMRQLEGQETP